MGSLQRYRDIVRRTIVTDRQHQWVLVRSQNSVRIGEDEIQNLDTKSKGDLYIVLIAMIILKRTDIQRSVVGLHCAFVSAVEISNLRLRLRS